MVRKILKFTKDWNFDAVSIGYPGVVRYGKIVREPHNLVSGWFVSIFSRRSGVR